MQKGIVLIWLVTAVLVAIIGGGTYLFVTGKINPQNSPTTQSQSVVPPVSPIVNNPLESDKTYSDTEGYRFKYPKDWIVESYKEKFPSADNAEENRGQSFFSSRKITPEDGQGLPLDLGTGSIRFTTTQFLGGTSYAKIAEKDFFNLEDKETWRQGEVGGGGPGYTYSVPNEVIVDGKRAVMQKYHPTKSYEATSPDDITINYFIWLGDNKIMHIVFGYNDKNPNKEALLKSLNTIIATLEFTK